MIYQPSSLVFDPGEIREIELVVNARARSLLFGEHASVFSSALGFEPVGLRKWEPGDPVSRLDQPHSIQTSFNPPVVKEFVESRSVTVEILADASLSTHCGAQGLTIAKVIARTIATLGFSAALFSDPVGLLMFGGRGTYKTQRPGYGRKHIFQILRLYQEGLDKETRVLLPGEEFIALLARQNASHAFLPVISDFLFPEADSWIGKLAEARSSQDIFLVLIDSDFAFRLPLVSDGWVRCLDVESDREIFLSKKQVRNLASEAKRYQDRLMAQASRVGLEVLKLSPSQPDFLAELTAFFLKRRLKKIRE